MARGRRAIGLTTAILVLLGTTGCGQPGPRTVSEAVSGPPYLSDWIEIEGQWQVSYDDGEGHALMQPAIADSWLSDESQDDPRDAVEALWVDVATGEPLWSRSDLGDPIAVEGDTIIAMVGAGDDRTVEAIDTATGDTVWSVPETDLGDCAGWYRIGDREVDVDDGTRSFPILAAPQACDSSRRTLLAQLDPVTGVAEPLLVGSGRLATERVGDTIVAMTWSATRVKVELIDQGTGTLTGAVDLRTGALVAGSAFSDRVALPEHSSVTLVRAAGEAIWVSVRWNDPDDDHEYDVHINDFRIDLETAGLERRWNEDCLHPGGVAPFYFQWIPSVGMCGAIGLEETEAHITTGIGDGASTWLLPIVGERPNWVRAECPSEDEETEPRQMLLVPAADALVRAYDLYTGETLWSHGEGRPGGRLMVAGHSEAVKLVVLADTAAGAQSVSVLNPCTGAPISEVPVEGAFLDGRYVPAVGSIVTVPLARTTLLAHFVDRGAPAGDAEAAEGDEQV